MAPEVIDGGAHSPALDMFAVGVMLYITITGRRPMTNRQANTLTYSTFEAWEYPHMHVRATSLLPQLSILIWTVPSILLAACSPSFVV